MEHHHEAVHMKKLLCKILGHTGIEGQFMEIIGLQLFYGKSIGKTKEIRCTRCNKLMSKIPY